MRAFFTTLVFITTFCYGVKHVDLTYGSHERQKLDIFLPATKAESYPVAFLIHGGGWKTGDKAHAAFIEQKRSYFHSLGWAVVSVNYRLSPEITHPKHAEDVYAAFAWMQKEGVKYQLNTEYVIVGGHSAGAHLAAMIGTDHDRMVKAGANPKSIKGVFLLDGSAYDVPSQIDSAGRLTKNLYLGAFSSNKEVQKDASPTFKIKKDRTYAPFLILTCSNRKSAVTQSVKLSDALKEAGTKVMVIPFAQETHSSINRDFGTEKHAPTEAFSAYFKEILKP